MTDEQRCTACNALLPIARSSAMTWGSGLVVTGLGMTAAKTWWGRILIAAAGVAAIALVDELARPACGRCGTAG